jgi:carbamoyl-phosphate synthase small subunit
MSTSRPARLALQDGTVFEGIGFGAETQATGEACFNTGMTGYQEVLTDPSYHGQIVTMTSVQIGNTGVNEHDDQSRRPWVAGFVVRDLCEHHSSWRATGTLDDYLKRHGIPGITEIDTRRLTRHLREAGAMNAAIGPAEGDPADLVDLARTAPSMVGLDLAKEVSTTAPYRWGLDDLHRRAREGYAAGRESAPATAALMKNADDARRFKVAALDLGMKQNILDLLVASGNEVTVLPATTSAGDIIEAGYDGVFLSNGPGDPEPVTYAIETVRSLVGSVPVFGICLGHQILGLALGASTFKLKFGHRGSNHPVKRVDRDHIEITCQNHGFAVDQSSIAATGATLTHVNLNDSTVEGLEFRTEQGLQAYSVQYHPEAGPGPHDSRYLFEEFRTLMETYQPAQQALRA